MQRRLLDALDELRKQPGVEPANAGAIGFCAGGNMRARPCPRRCRHLGAASPSTGVYDAPPFPNAAITAKLLVCDGWNDPLCPPAAKNGLCEELTAAGVDWQFISYSDTGHWLQPPTTRRSTPEKTWGFQPTTSRRSWGRDDGLPRGGVRLILSRPVAPRGTPPASGGHS